jgi:hypothetical protein
VSLLLAGRGFGKTRSGAECIRDQVIHHRRRRIALVAPTAADARDVMVEGESGLLGIGPPQQRPRYEPTKRRLTWPNGAIATTYSADEPERLRGPQHDAAWCDEIASWRYPEAWDMLMFGADIIIPCTNGLLHALNAGWDLAASAMTWALLITGTASKSKVSRVLPAVAELRQDGVRGVGGCARLSHVRPMPGSVLPASLPCRPGRQAKPRPVSWRAGATRREAARCERRRRDRSFSCHTNQLDGAELVIKMHRRHLDGDVGNGGWMRREAPVTDIFSLAARAE